MELLYYKPFCITHLISSWPPPLISIYLSFNHRCPKLILLVHLYWPCEIWDSYLFCQLPFRGLLEGPVTFMVSSWYIEYPSCHHGDTEVGATWLNFPCISLQKVQGAPCLGRSHFCPSCPRRQKPLFWCCCPPPRWCRRLCSLNPASCSPPLHRPCRVNSPGCHTSALTIGFILQSKVYFCTSKLKTKIAIWSSY